MKKILIVFLVVVCLAGVRGLEKIYAVSNDLSAAKEAFSAQNYEVAIQKFEENLQKNPSDVPSLKYIGLAYIKLNNPQKAISYLEKAKEADPQNSSVRYYLAQSYYLAGDTAHAKEEISYIEANFPANIYRQKAQALKNEITKPVKMRKPLSVYQRISYQYDSNVALDPQKLHIRDLDEQSSRFASYTWVELIMLQDQAWWAGVDGSFYQSLHTEDDCKQFNLSGFEVAPFFNFILPVSTYALNNRVEYRYIDDILNGHSFCRTHRIHYHVSSFVRRWLEMLVYTQVDFDDFFFRGLRVDKYLFDRDAVKSESGFQATIFLPEKRTITMGYDFTHNDSQGMNWNYTRNRIFAEFMTPFIYPHLYLFLLSEYHNRFFDPFSGEFYNSGADRNEDTYSFRVKSQYVFTRNAALETSYRYTKRQTSLEEFFEYERSIFDVSFIFWF